MLKEKNRNELLKEYAIYFTAFLFSNLKEKENIEKIILFGSVAKNQAEKDSDIDIFVEVKKKSKKFENIIKDLEEKFYTSREASLFKLKKIENKFNIKIGKLNEWKDLKRSIISTGIILFGQYQDSELPSDAKHFVIIYWDKIGRNRGAFLNKIYGFKIKDKTYEGLISKFSGKKLGKSCIMIPIQYKKDILNLLENYKVEAKILEVFS